MANLLQMLLVLLAVTLVGMPVVTLLHELGHAVAAALAVGGRVTVVQGPAPARLTASIWRLDLRLHGPIAPHQGMIGWAMRGPHQARWRHAVAMAAGPLVSGLCAAGCLFAAGSVPSLWRSALDLLAGASTLQMLSSGLPLRYGRWCGEYAGQASDGLRIRRLLQGNPEPRPQLQPR